MRLSLTARVPIILPSINKWPRNPHARDREKKRQQRNVAYSCRQALFPVNAKKHGLPWRVQLIRHGRALEGDNLISSFKYVRDQVAIELGAVELKLGKDGKLHGHGQGDEKIPWLYLQDGNFVEPWGVTIVAEWATP